MEAQRRKTRPLRFRYSQSLAGRRHRLSQPMVLSTIQRLGSTTNFPASDRLTISTLIWRHTTANLSWNFHRLDVNRRDGIDPTQISDVKDLACRSASAPHADSQPRHRAVNACPPWDALWPAYVQARPFRAVARLWNFPPSTFAPKRRLRSRAPLSFATSMAFSNSETAPRT
jgi:hypothetical protein